jgi:hypothetical protein
MIKRGMWEKIEARADLSADKLTTSTGYNRKVEVSTSFWGLPMTYLPQRAIRTWRPEASKEVVLSI